MTTSPTWPSRGAEAPPPNDDHAARDSPVPAHLVIGEMASLLRDNRSEIITDACLLGAVIVGAAYEAGHWASGLRPGLAGLAGVVALGAMLLCWLAAAGTLIWAGRPVLNRLSELRWVTGAPLDPRAGWVTLPPVGADPADWTWNRAYLLLGAARLARCRLQYADTWTYLAGGCFLAWTAVVVLGR
jgi:hypothetical protein